MNLWPEETGHPQTGRKQVKAAFAESIKKEYPVLAERLSFPQAAGTPRTGSSEPRINGWLKNLSADETFTAARLTAAEQTQIIDQVTSTSFDTPDSWDTELRVRRISLGQSDGLIVRGTRLLCGGTGNCETWVFYRSADKWLNLFEQEAPIVSKFRFEQQANESIRDFLVSANTSATGETRVLFKFNGKAYRKSECYEVWVDGAAERVEKVTCQ